MDDRRRKARGSRGEFPSIRQGVAGDAAAVRPLLGQLGYDLEEPEIERRIARIAGAAGHCLLVAEDNEGRPVALLHVFGRAALEKPPEAVVQALVVRDGVRRRGLGRAMMALAEKWAVERGYRYISLGSQVGREQAHAFYRRLGYERYATSHQFRKSIEA